MSRPCDGESPPSDFASAQEAGLDGVADSELLDRAFEDGRVLISHDRRTMLNHFRAHLVGGKSSPGLLIVSQGAPIGQVVEAIVYVWAFADLLELRDQVHYLPSISRHVFSSEPGIAIIADFTRHTSRSLDLGWPNEPFQPPHRIF